VFEESRYIQWNEGVSEIDVPIWHANCSERGGDRAEHVLRTPYGLAEQVRHRGHVVRLIPLPLGRNLLFPSASCRIGT